MQQSITTVDSAIAHLESLGFVNKKQNARLLQRTNNDVVIVANFLSAKRALHNAIRNSKKVAIFVGNGIHCLKTAKVPSANPVVDIKKDHSDLIVNAQIDTVANTPADKNEKRRLTKEERLARKEERLRLRAQKQDEAKEQETAVSSNTADADVETKEEKRPRLTKEERLAKRELRLKLRIQRKQDQASVATEEGVQNEEKPQRPRLTKEERLARKAERLRLKLGAMNKNL